MINESRHRVSSEKTLGTEVEEKDKYLNTLASSTLILWTTNLPLTS